MWNPIMKPTPLTIESLEISRQKRSERNRRRNTSPINRSSRPDPCLKSGSYLQAHRRLFFTPELVNVPLEDLDPFYLDAETFVVVTEKKFLHRFSAQNALNIFSPFNKVRRICISVLHHWIYRWFMIMTALMDCCLLTQPNHEHQRIVFYIFGAIYTFDFVTNVIAKGLLFDQFTFLRDGWGIVDLLLLVPYYIPFIGRHHFLCGLRSLKIAALVPSLKSMVKAVLKTGTDLRDMFLWTLFATWIFALVGYHFYKGVSTQKCVHDFPEDGSVGENRDLDWHVWISNSSNWYSDYRSCGNHSMTWQCPTDMNLTCLQIHGNYENLYSSMGGALMSTVQIMLQDSWDDIYFHILRSGGPWHALYFVTTLFLGSFYTLNMILAVVSKSYDDLQNELKLAEKLESSRLKRSTSNIVEENENNDLDERHHNDNNNAGLNMIFNYLDSYHKHPIIIFWKWFTNLINVIVFYPFTELTMVTVTIANLIFLSMDRFPDKENEELHTHLVSGYQVFGIMFAVECLLKFIACGPISYFKDKWNIFDFWQTILFLVEYKFEYKTGWMKALLSLRSLRIFQLLRIWPTVNSMLDGVFSTIGIISDMTIVAIGVFYMFCVAGVHLFGGKIETRHPDSHWHFRDFWHSFMVIFRLLCGEWKATMSECVDDHGWTCIPFFMSAVIVLDLIVLNLLLVTFLQRFSARNASKNSSKVKSDTRQESAIRDDLNNDDEALVTTKTFYGCPRLRIKLQTIMNSKYFKYFSIANTIIATICLSLRDVHLKSRPLLQDLLDVVDDITLFFMTVEAAIKIVAIGFSAYLKNYWNRLDFLIVLGGILNIFTWFFTFGYVSFFRSMRVLRLFSNFEGMRIIFNSLGRAMSKIFGILLVCLLIWLVFAIMGSQLLSGGFLFCYDVERNEMLDARIIRNYTECLQFNFTWANKIITFDNVGSSYFRVLEIITFKGWGHSFERATSFGDINEQPSFEKSFWISGYFVAVILFGSFFAFNLFTGVLIDALNEEKSKIEKGTEYRKENGCYEARKCMQVKLKTTFSSVDTHKRKYQKFISGVVTSKHLGIVILIILVLNMVLLSLEQEKPNLLNKDALAVLNGFCTAFLAFDCLLNMFEHQYRFFRNPLNMFELLTELLSVFDIFWTDVLLKTSLLPFRPGLLRLVRFAGVSRYLRHVKAADGLRKLLYVLQISLPAFSNICVLLVLVVFIYALLGMELFKDHEVFSYDTEYNFKTLPHAFIVIFPSTTSASWNILMYFLSVGYCDKIKEDLYDVCRNATAAEIYVISYLFITFVILLNLYSAVILESCSRAIKLVECELGDEHFEMFYQVWSQFEKENSQFASCNDLSDLFESFEPPLQVAKPNRCAISLMNVSIYQGNLVHCADVLDAAITFLYFRKGFISVEDLSLYQDEAKIGRDCKLEMTSSTYQQQRELQSAKIIQRTWRNRNAFFMSSLQLWKILPFQTQN